MGQLVKDREREDGRRWILWGRLPRLGQVVKDRERERMVGDGSCGVGCLGWGSWSRIEREDGRRWILWGRLPRFRQLVKDRERGW